MLTQVIQGQKCYQLLHEAAAQSLDRRDRSGQVGQRRSSSDSTSTHQSHNVSPVSNGNHSERFEEEDSTSNASSVQSSVSSSDDASASLDKNKYKAAQRQLNVHAGMHSELSAVYFVTLNNVTTFNRESKHKSFSRTLRLEYNKPTTEE
ncbi:hypothetical protein MMC09_003369 [Bachmanniomyces sp. S44760]|nr:hypothetical protein [Bachmanniomyces sp. S44760]